MRPSFLRMSSGTLPQTTSRERPATAPRTASRQAADLARWLETKPVATQPAPRPADARAAPSRTERLSAREDLVEPLREALAEQGLAILPDPLHRFPCAKVVRVSDLL